ncbi:MAG: NDP-sugar synthase [Candidatus Melainabacteria bacterium]|nr:NDP-sugar synthase [Candidatus Melainabacteria bacterium]MBI3308465.1 NDP-sugar synthase [Candidatus Melainabacteria bacterium]
MREKKHNQAMILAAGVGSRLDPLTRGIPKPLAPIVGAPVMEHIINLCKEHGFTDLSANIHVKADRMREYFSSEMTSSIGVSLKMVHEKELTGVAGGIRSCKKYLTQDVVLIIMGDALTDANLSMLYEKHLKSGCAVTAGIMEIDDTSQFGVIVTDKNDRIVSFQEKPKSEEAKSNLANTGIYFFNKSVLDEMPSKEECPIYDVAKDLFPKLMSHNILMQAIKIEGYWADIGTLKQYKQSIEDILSGKVKIKFSAKKTNFGYQEQSAVLDPSVKNLGKAYIGKNVRIGANVTLCGTVCIEEGCRIEEGSYIDNSILWQHSHVSKNTKVINSILGNDCKVSEGVEVISNSVWAPETTIERSSKPNVVLK